MLEVLRRPSPFWPATNETSRGEDGCEALLGDELDWLNPEGDEGRLEALALDSVRCIGIGSIGLPSSVGWGELTLVADTGVLGGGLLWAAIASARSF